MRLESQDLLLLPPVKPTGPQGRPHITVGFHQVKPFWVEPSPRPPFGICMILMLQVPQGLQEPLVSRNTANVFRWPGAFPGKA